MDIQHVDRSNNILPLVKQEKIMDKWLETRLEKVLRNAMNDEGIPMWITISKEYNEDPVIKSITPSLHDSSGRISILVHCYDNETDVLESYFIGSAHPGHSNLYENIWNRQKETVWECLRNLVENKQPSSIAINTSENIAVADGLTKSLYSKLCKELTDKWVEKFISSERLVVRWFLERTDEEMLAYRFISDLTSNLAKRSLSNEVIYPGITTTEEVVQWIRQKVSDLGLTTSFYPTIDVQRKGAKVDRLNLVTILPGDIVHLDFGIDYLGLCTDTQQLGYVLGVNEEEVPEGLNEAFKHALNMEDIVISHMKPNKTGNDIFTSSIKDAKERNLQAMLYSHPIGFHCHEAGPNIGLYDKQEELPFHGEFKVIENSAYALEFNVKCYIPEWRQETYIYLEQPIGVNSEGAYYLTPRQEEFYVIR